MRISNINLRHEDGCAVLSGMCNDFELFYKFPNHIEPQTRADAFVAACLIPAMASGTDIELDDDAPISRQLLINLDKLQDIFCQWTQYFKTDLHKISIKGGVADELKEGLDKTISFFSGGIDGHYTLIKNSDSIDLLFFSKGIDIQLDNDHLFQEALSKNRKFVQQKKKPLLSVESNVRFLGHTIGGLGWGLCFGGGLSSIALAANVRKCFIASGVTYQTLYPEGSNFITDHLWSNEFTQVVHDGAEASRIEKLRVISQDPEVLKLLRVCWQDKKYNCGKCEKCIRTMIALRALQLSADTLPDFTDAMVKRALRKIRLYTPIDYAFLMENLEQARRVEDKTLIKELLKIKRRFEIRKLLFQFDQTILAGRIARWKRKHH